MTKARKLISLGKLSPFLWGIKVEYPIMHLHNSNFQQVPLKGHKSFLGNILGAF